MTRDGESHAGTRGGGRAQMRVSHTGSELQLNDVCVIYPADEPTEKWPKNQKPPKFVAHGLETSQVGVGQTPLEAYTNLLCALIVLFHEKRCNPDVEVYKRAPDKVVAKYAKSSRLPIEIQEWAIENALANSKGLDGWIRKETKEAEELPISEIDVSQELLPDDTGQWYSVIHVPSVAAA